MANQAASKAIQFAYNGTIASTLRKFAWTNLWGGREYGLQFHDTYFEPAPEVTEALRRLNLKEPHVFDQRKIRLSRAHTLALHGEKLPKAEWTKWNQESWYLKPYLDEIEAEKKARAESSGLIPPYEMKQH
uniref:Cytochrome b-c1 complex subunit 7 n=1 Tax=Caenorhabditis tropicalis TaxID=1561998 RepID=A0A1I7UGN3_9PELO